MKAQGCFVEDADLVRYRTQVDKFLQEEMDGERFTAARLQMGVYGQRQSGVHMVRIKLPGGRINPNQLRAVSRALAYSTAPAHITTRQDIQMHYIPLSDTPKVLTILAESGLTTREACGNTVRNVTACAMSGVCPREEVDINHYLEGAVDHFIRYPLNQQMPRKFKISFSGCASDCAQGLMHDLGVIAITREGKKGFRLLAGGGLGHKPRHAMTLAEFIEEKDLLAAMEAVITLHDRHSDRERRAKARIKFLVEKLGEDEFRRQFEEIFARARVALALQPHPTGPWRAPDVAAEAPGHGAPRHALPQHQQDLWAVPLSVPLGHLSAKQLTGLADALDAHGVDEIRTTQDQNLLALNVPQDKKDALLLATSSIGLDAPKAGDNVVACPGTGTCRLGVTASMNFAPVFRDGAHNSVRDLDLRLRVSGCHNGCAQPETGDIGIYGEGRRRHGHLIPFYQFYVGGQGTGGGGLALKGPEIPAMRAEAAIECLQSTYRKEREVNETFFQWTRRRGIDSIKELLASFAEVSPEEALSFARDYGEDHKFQVVPLGGGECAGAVQMQIGHAFFEAAHEGRYRDAFLLQGRFVDVKECVEAQLSKIAESLAQFLGRANVDIEVQPWLASQIETSALAKEMASHLSAAKALPVGSEAKAQWRKLCDEVDEWLIEVARLVQGKDANVDLEEALPGAAMLREAVVA